MGPGRAQWRPPPERQTMTMHPRISADAVAAIRARYAGGESAARVGRDYDLHPPSAWRIATGRSHADLPLVDLTRRVPIPRRLRGDAHPLRRHPELAVRGEDHPNAKLRECDVLAIRAHSAAGEDAILLADAYGVTRSCIWAVVKRKRWRHVLAPLAKASPRPASAPLAQAASL